MMKMFASDYDGTFFKWSTSGVSDSIEENIRQVELWRAAGNLFVFATGRSISQMALFTPRGISYDYLIGLNGAVIVSAKTEPIIEEAISPSVAKEIMTLLKSEANIYDYSAIYGKKDGPSQISFTMNSPDDAIKFASFFNSKFDGKAIAFSNERHIDINAQGISKATGVARIAELHNIGNDNIYAMGDSYNDIPMLSAYTGFTLPEASDVVKAKATAVHNSVADALKSLLKGSAES